MTLRFCPIFSNRFQNLNDQIKVIKYMNKKYHAFHITTKISGNKYIVLMKNIDILIFSLLSPILLVHH